MRYHPLSQKYYIKSKLHGTYNPNLDETLKSFSRNVEEAFLKRWFRSLPAGPIVIVGPTGSGRSYIVRKVLKGRKMVIFTDFRKEPVVSGEEFIGTFIQNLGYRVSTPTEISKIFIKEEQRKNKVTSMEVDRALAIAFELLIDIKKKNKELPIFILNDYNHHFKVNGELDPFWLKFIDWTIHVTDMKLAHVVLIPSIGFAHPHLYELHPFRTKRVLLYVDFPNRGRVIKYIKDICSNMDIVDVQTRYERQRMIDWIANCVGGHLDDLTQTLYSLRRGDRYGSVLKRLITDSVSFVEDSLENILAEAESLKDGRAKEDVYEKYLRLWKLIAILRDKEYVNRRDLVKDIFGSQYTSELQQYIVWGLVTYTNQRPEIQDMDSASSELEVDYSYERRVPSFWRMYNEDDDGKSEAPKLPNQEEEKVDDSSEQVVSVLLNSSLDSLIVCAASPRIRIAFDLLLKDKRLHEQREKVRVHLEKKKLTDNLKKSIEKREQLRTERKGYVVNYRDDEVWIYFFRVLEEIEKTIKHEQELFVLFGEDKFKKDKTKLLESLEVLTDELSNYDKDIEIIENDLKLLK